MAHENFLPKLREKGYKNIFFGREGVEMFFYAFPNL